MWTASNSRAPGAMHSWHLGGGGNGDGGGGRGGGGVGGGEGGIGGDGGRKAAETVDVDLVAMLP